MKKFILYLLVAFFTFSCGDKDEPVGPDEPTAPEAVSNVTYRVGYGEVTLMWESPEDNYSYTSIEYIQNGEAKSIQAKDSVTITGFEDTAEYEFKLYAVSKDQQKSEDVVVKIAPLDVPSTIVLETIKCEAVSGGIKYSWSNTTGKFISFSVSYKDRYGDKKTVEKISDDATGVLTVTDIPLNISVESEITVSVVTAGVKSQQKTTTLSIETFEDFSVTSWTIESVSSEETVGEGTSNGKAIFSIDGNTSTYWHTQWQNAPPRTLPNWIVYDMKRVSEITWIKLTQRAGKNSLLDVEIFAKNKLDDEWISYGTIKFSTTTVELSKQMNLTNSAQGRYFKLNFPTSQSAIQTMLAEVEVLGSITEVGYVDK